MQRIIYPVSTLSRTGPTSQLLNIVSHLDKDVFEPTVLTLSPEPEDSRSDDFKAAGIEVLSLNMSRLEGFFRGRKAFRAIMGRLAPALIHSQGFRGDMLSAACDVSIPRIATIRNFPQSDYPMAYGLPGHIMARIHMRAVERLDCAVGVSGAVEKNLRTHFGLRKTLTISNGVDLSRFSSTSPEHVTQLRQRLNFSQTARLWISSGNLSPRKAPMNLLSAWFEAFHDDQDQELILLGDGPLMDTCRDFVGNRRSVRIVGGVTNVSDYLRAADVFVSASLAEGLPNAAIEAMACGLPVVLSDIEPHRELYSTNSHIGALFPVGDIVGLREMLRRFATIHLNDISAVSEQVARASFSANVMAARYQDLYDRLLAGSVK